MLPQLYPRMFFVLCLAWAIPVILFILNPSYNIPAWPAWLATSVSLVLGLINKKFIAFSIPFIALLSPLAHNGKLFGLLPSEVFVAISFILVVATFIAKQRMIIKLCKGDNLLLGLLIIVLISYIFSFEYLALVKSLVSWLIIFAVFVISRTYLTVDDIGEYFGALLVAVFFSSLISYIAYLNFMSLNDFMHTDISKKFYYYDTIFYFRANYFYDNFGFILGSCVLISLINIFYLSTRKYKILYSFLFIFFISLLLIMSEKTGLVGVVLTAIILLFGSLLKSKIRLFSLASFVFGIFFLGGLLLFIFQIISNIDNFSLNIAGLTARLCVYSSAIGVLIENPLRFIFVGFGPDYSNIILNSTTLAAKMNCEGTPQGAIDSGYVTFLFEYGMLFVLILLIFFMVHIVRMKYMISRYNSNRLYIYLIAVIIYVNFSAMTDVVGTSKTAWIITQIISFLGLLAYNKSKLIEK